MASSREGGSDSLRPLLAVGACGSQAGGSSDEVVLPVVDREEVDTVGSLDVGSMGLDDSFSSPLHLTSWMDSTAKVEKGWISMKRRKSKSVTTFDMTLCSHKGKN